MFVITSHEIDVCFGYFSKFSETNICTWFKIGQSQKAFVKHTMNNIMPIRSEFNSLLETWDLKFKI